VIKQADWHWGISNAGQNILLLSLEPWADEIEVPCRSTATLRISNACSPRDELDVEDTGEHLVIWASGGDRVEVYIDEIRQHTASATISVPEEMGLSTRNLLGVLFNDQPAARLAGQQSLPPATFLWHRLRHYFGF
jgi:hypothetical protein